MIKLYINKIKIINEDSYAMSIEDKFSDSSGETEAGTQQYDCVRKNVHMLSLSYTVTDQWLARLSAFRSKDTLSVSFYDELTRKQKDLIMKMKNFRYDHDSKSRKRNAWSVSFDLEEI